MSQYIKQCPICQAEILYKHKGYFERSVQKNTTCRKCQVKKQNLKKTGLFFKNCPQCNEKIIFTHKNALETSLKKNSLCSSCCNKGEKNGMFGKTGERCHWFGKKHTEETKSKLARANTGRKRTEETKRKISEYKKIDNPMKDKRFYFDWVKKYGQQIADEKMESYRQKRIYNSTGKRGPSFGKPPPQSGGWGLSGWFNNFYFRSLRELMFLIYSKRFNFKILSGECSKYGILYSGDQKTYFVDFIINNKFYVEIKPKGLQFTQNNLEKFKAAEEFCLKNNFIFKVIDPPINFKLIYTLYNKKEIKFTIKSEEKFLKYIQNKNS